MARLSKPGLQNYTALGSRAGSDHGKVHIETPGKSDKPGVLILDSVNDSGVVTPYYVWVDSNGDLRVHTALPTDQDSDGTIVGTQS